MSEPTYAIAADGSAILCRRCGLTSYHPMDVAHRYCSACKVFHDAAPDVPGAGAMIDLAALRDLAASPPQGEPYWRWWRWFTQMQEAVQQLATQLEQRDQTAAKVMILEAQLGAWEAACAAQVLAARQVIERFADHRGCLVDDPALDQALAGLETAIDSNAGELLRRKLQQTEVERDTARAALRALEQRIAAEADEIGRQRWRADGLATTAAIVLHELERDGQIQEHTRSLLAAAVGAYEAGKAGAP